VPPHLTSTLQPTFVVAQSLGSLIATVSAYLLPPDTSPPSVLSSVTVWRYLFALPITFCAVALLILLLPITTDTPKYYLICEEEEKARTAIKKVYKGDTDRIVQYIRSTI